MIYAGIGGGVVTLLDALLTGKVPSSLSPFSAERDLRWVRKRHRRWLAARPHLRGAVR